MYKVVIRLMSDKDVMLGWAETQAHARGDGKLWIEHPVNVPVVEDGNLDYILSHWADVNIAVRSTVPERPVPLDKGMILPLGAPWMAFDLGEPAGGLPPVTVGSSIITVPTGSLGATGN